MGFDCVFERCVVGGGCECFGCFEGADGGVEEGEDVAWVGVEAVIGGHDVDDFSGREAVGSEFEEVVGEFCFWVAAVGVIGA